MERMSLDRFTAVLFDMDGLLIDSEQAYLECFVAACNGHGFVAHEEVYRRCIGTPWQRTHEILREGYGVDFPLEQVVGDAKSCFERRLAAGRVAVKPGARELLAALRSRQLDLAVVTSTETAAATRHLTSVALAGCFKLLVGGDRVSRGKPAPDIYLLTADLLGKAPNLCLVLEDSENGVRSALAAGMQVIQIPDLLPAPDLRDPNHHVLGSLTDVLGLLER